jgi:hypothetical protein
MLDALKNFFGRSATVNEQAVVPEVPLRVHGLRDGFCLSSEQYAYCVKLVDRVERLYREGPAYAANRGLDPSLVFAGNEWADMVPAEGVVFRRTYNDVNYLRLMAPFAGYFLMFLDRLDVRFFAEPWNEQFLADINRNGIREVDPGKRLAGCVKEYREHIRNVPKQYVVKTPRMFGEIGVEVDGLLVNPDVTLCQSRINGMLCSGVLDKLHADIARRGRARVLEIGAGFGPLGQALKNIFGDGLEYVVVDLPSILYNSSLYLSTLANGEGCHVLLPGEKVPDRFNFLFVANYLLDELGHSLGPIDLALNTMSFPEMSPAQVRYYAEYLKGVLRPDGVVFDENAAVKPHHTNSKAIFAEVFPYRKSVCSDVVMTKNWCQDVWASSYVGKVFDCSDAMFLR